MNEEQKMAKEHLSDLLDIEDGLTSWEVNLLKI